MKPVADAPELPVDFDGQSDDAGDDDGGYGMRNFCRHCSGTGGEPFDDFVTPCSHCDGEGYHWWRT